MKKRWIAVILSATLVFSNSGMVLAQENSQGLNNGNESYSESADLYDQAIDSELEIYSSDEVPDYDLWMADTMLYGMFGDGDGLYSTFESFQDPVYKQLGGYLLDDTSLVTISAAWSVYFNNTYRSQFADEQKYIYETLLMSYLTYEADEDSGHSIETELLDDVSKFSADLYQAAAEELSENPVYYIRNLTVDEAETFLKNLSTIENISTAIDYINDASDAVQSADDLINAVSEYMALQQVKEERIALIQSARDACAAMSTPNQGFIDACDEITEMLENLDVGYFFGETVLTNLWSKAIEKGWDALCDANVILKTVDLSVSGLNILFDTTDSASNNLKLALLYTMDCYMQMGMMTAAADYMNDWTDTAAAVNYLSCFRGYLEFQMFGNDFAVTWLEDYLDSGIITNIINNIFYEENIETANELISRANTETANRERLLNLIEQYGEIYFGLYGNLEWEEFLSGDSEEVSADIPDGAVKYKGHYYYVFDLEDLSLIGAEAFAWAEEYCESLGGHLATITSAEEDSFVFQAMKNQGYSNAYFGFTDEAEEGTWVWVTGEEVSYTNWSSGEPNNEAGKEDYAMYYYRNTTGMWNDGGFNTSTVSGGHAFICEWDTGDTTTTASDTLCLRRGNTFYINYTLEGGNADLTFTYGRASDEVLIGDWDGDGIDTICVRRGNRFYFSNTLGGQADFYIDFGRTSDEVVAGDWDGDGCDTICVRRGNHYYINNTLESGNAAIDFTFGRIDDEVLSGDWDGDGYDTLCIRRGITYYINNTLEGGNAAIHFTFGRTSDSVLSGDWDGDGCDTLCIRRGNHYYINNTLEGGNAAIDFTYGRTGDEVYAGVWYDGTVDVSLYFETYEYLVDVLGMTRTISWQFLSDDSYEADGFYLEWLYDTFSMKNEGAKNVSLYGIGIGSDVSEAAATLKNEGYEVSDE